MGASGWIWYSTARATVALVVTDGIVVEPCPPYARSWALGRDARELWIRGKQLGATLEWFDEPLAP